MKADILREKFLRFFKDKKHRIVESDSLVPWDDPTILFTPAGMNQFKKEFMGYDSGFKRAATSQRCLRTDDLEKVGKTCCHHTFFEMLGNFSFGDYFKEEAIAWAWEFLTEELKIKADRLWVSVYKDDNEAYKIWKDKIKIPADKIVKLGDKENFWPSQAKEKGPNGPCGPCSEIFFDFGNDTGCKKPDCNPSCSCGRFTEVWNLVFTQFNRKDGGVLEPLPNKNIDTGMGLERLAAVMQGAPNNFETDLFKPLIKEIEEGLSPKGAVPKNELIYAIADHIRAVTFAVYDGILPSNEGRGYVVRKIIRKSILHLKSLGIKHEFLYRLVPVLAEIMKEPYPDLGKRRENVSQVILAEEKNFISVLNSSDVLFKEKFRQLIKNPDPESAGAIAFNLYDTHGIPLELTKDWLSKQNIKFYQADFVDLERVFNQELEKQKSRSKLTSSMRGDVFDIKDLDVDVKETKFLGYEDCETSAKILKIIKDNSAVKKVSSGEEAKIILDKTVFYAESGGQVGDRGEIVKGKNIFEVLDTRKSGKAVVHIGMVKAGTFKKGDTVAAKVNIGRRLSIARNHTATHLLQAALRKVLGQHVQQQGSLVAEDRLRFDFTHFKAIDKEELERVEEAVNNWIINNYPVVVKQKTLAEAKKTGALAFFGDKYEGRVRVISIGDVSKELCGGTHLDAVGSIGIFKITHEGSIASGVRRIEGATGAFAYKVINANERIISEVESILNVEKDRIPQQIQAKLSRIKELEKKQSTEKLGNIKDSVDNFLNNAQVINGIRVITDVIADADMDLLRRTVDLIKEKTGNSIIALGSKKDGKALLVVGVTGDLTQKDKDASKIIREIAMPIGGSGGGRPDFAQAGGGKPENFASAFERLKEILK